jgi:general secretion pathway protein A
MLIDRLTTYLLEANARGCKTVLIIDEAQNLSIDVLEQLRLLTNLETNRYKLLQIVLLGQPELLHILNRQEMRQLSQRITARCHLGALDAKEIIPYVQHRLQIAGCNSPLFPETLSKTLWQLTGGIPRLINLVCDRALLGAYALERKQVDNHILRQAAHEVLGSHRIEKERTKPTLAAGLVCVVLLLLIVGFWSWKTSLFATVSQPVEPGEIQAAVMVEKTVQTAVTSWSTSGELLLNSWPEDFAKSQSMESSFDDLAGLWGLSPADRSDFCSYAIENGLSCLLRKDSLERLRSINRPALLKLYDDIGAPFHVVMTRLQGDRARFIAGATQYDLASSVLTKRWFGEYLLLWQRPPLQREFLKPGETGDSVIWLAKTLQELSLYDATGREVRLNGPLLNAFKKFQLSNDLIPDGVLGSMTLIHLNSSRNLNGPRLYPRGSS